MGITATTLHRRALLATTAGMAVISTLPQGGSAQEASPAASPVAGWTFTDDKGVTITLPSQPVRIAAALNDISGPLAEAEKVI